MMNVCLAQNVHHSFKYFGNNLLQFCVPFSPKSDNFVTECLLLLLLFWLFHFIFFSQPIQNIHHGIHNTDLWNHLGEVVVQERTLTPLSVLFTGTTYRIPFWGTHPTFLIMSLILFIPARHSCLVLGPIIRFPSFTFKLSWRTFRARILQTKFMSESIRRYLRSRRSQQLTRWLELKKAQ